MQLLPVAGIPQTPVALLVVPVEPEEPVEAAVEPLEPVEAPDPVEPVDPVELLEEAVEAVEATEPVELDAPEEPVEESDPVLPLVAGKGRGGGGGRWVVERHERPGTQRRTRSQTSPKSPRWQTLPPSPAGTQANWLPASTLPQQSEAWLHAWPSPLHDNAGAPTPQNPFWQVEPRQQSLS